MLVTEDRADHIDLNFGCPVPKVTRKGGGSALPWKKDLFKAIVGAVVEEGARRDIPVTVKMRKGIDDEHLTFLDAGLTAEAEGVAAVALHGRTAAQAYSGTADWSAIRMLKETVTSIPVLGNGDIWSAEDALRMVRETGCDGVVVGRGCLGRPWLFTDLAAAFAGTSARVTPTLGEVADTLRTHTAYLCDFYGEEERACRDIRKHIAWYLKGFPAGSTIRNSLALVDSMAALDALLASLDPDEPWPGGDVAFAVRSDIDLAQWPHVSAWAGRIAQRPQIRPRSNCCRWRTRSSTKPDPAQIGPLCIVRNSCDKRSKRPQDKSPRRRPTAARDDDDPA